MALATGAPSNQNPTGSGLVELQSLLLQPEPLWCHFLSAAARSDVTSSRRVIYSFIFDTHCSLVKRQDCIFSSEKSWKCWNLVCCLVKSRSAHDTDSCLCSVRLHVFFLFALHVLNSNELLSLNWIQTLNLNSKHSKVQKLQMKRCSCDWNQTLCFRPVCFLTLNFPLVPPFDGMFPNVKKQKTLVFVL